MRLSVCVIARDEESTIARTLESVKAIADEIVVVDTGSTDATLEAASRYTKKLFTHPRADEWRERPDLFEFHEARNYALDQCMGDWILSIDCDEELCAEDAPDVRRILESAADDIALVMPTIVMRNGDGTEYQRFLAERLLRSGARFDGAMHNWVTLPEGTRKAEAPGIRIDHNRAVKTDEARTRRAEQRVAMAERVFKEKIEADPTDARSLFYLAGTLYDAKRHAEAVEWFGRYFAVSQWPEERYQAAILCAQSFMALDRRNEIKPLLSAYYTDNYRRAEADLMLGEMAEHDGDLEQALHWYRVASLKPPPVDPLFVEMAAHTYMPHAKLWQVYSRLGQSEHALRHGRLAVENGCPNTGVFARYENRMKTWDGKRYALVDRGQMDFIQPMIDAGWFDAAFTAADEIPGDAALVWCEWAGEEAIKFTRGEKRCRIVVRVHGYETHDGKLKRMDWLKVDDVIFVAEYLRDMALADCPVIGEACNVFVVPGGVETGKFAVADGKTGRRIAMACYGNYKKNLPMALQILAKLPSDYTLHVATRWQSHQLAMYVDHMIGELGLAGRVEFCPWQSDLNEFYADKDFYLSASIEESFHYALAEGMAAGLKPVIHCWKSARDFYNPEWIFKTVDEAVDMILAGCRPEEYREYAVEHLDVSRNLKRVRRILDRPTVRVAGQPSQQYAVEHKLEDALESLGCDVYGDNPAAVILTGRNPKIEPWMDGAYKVLWHTEQVVGEDSHAQNYRDLIAPVVPQVDCVMTHHPGAVELFRDMGARRAGNMPCCTAAHPFRRVGAEKQFDIGFSGYLNERRLAILERLGEEFDVHTLDSQDHEELNLFYNKCRIVLNLHCTDEPNLETRLGEAMAAGACVVSEPLPSNDLVGVVETNDLADAIRRLLADDALRQECADAGHEWIWRNMRLDQQVEKLLDLAEV